MMRGKRIIQKLIKNVIDNEFNNEPMKLYKYIFNGNTQMFDLTKRKPTFDMKNDISIATHQHFERQIKINYVEGKRDEYYNYTNVIDDGEDEFEADESAIDIKIEEDNKERNELIGLVKHKPLKILFSDSFHMTFIDLKHGTRINRCVEKKSFIIKLV